MAIEGRTSDQSRSVHSCWMEQELGKLLSLPYAFSFIRACALLIRELALRSPLQVASAWNSQENMRRGRFEPCLASEGDKLTPVSYLWAFGRSGWEQLRFGASARKMLTALKAPQQRAELAGQAGLQRGCAVP